MFSIFGNLGKFYDIFTKGKQVVDAVKTKNRQVFVNSLGAIALIGAGIYRGTGHDLPISDEDLLQLVGTLGVMLGLFNAGSTVASTDKIGLPPRQGGNAPIEDHSGIDGVPTVAETTAPAYVQPVDAAPAIYDSENPLAGLDTTYRG